MHRRAHIVLVIGVFASVMFNVRAERNYSITNLGNFGGEYGSLREINDSAQIIGSYERAGKRYNFIWENGTWIDIHVGDSPYVHIAALNQSGQVVGDYKTPSGNIHGFIWSNGEVTDVGALSNDFSKAQDINNRGQVVGWTSTPNPPDPRGDKVAFLWEDGVMKELGTLGGWDTEAHAINDLSQITGNSYDSNGHQHAVLWDRGVMIDLGSAYGGRDINQWAQVVGPALNGHAFLWDGGVMTDLGTLGGDTSLAYCINNSGQAVGTSRTASYQLRAVLWEPNEIVDLSTLLPEDSGWDHLARARSINNVGEIVGYGYLNGEHTSYLLTPIPKPADYDGDTRIDLRDFAVFASHWPCENDSHGGEQRGDLDKNGSLNLIDLSIFAKRYLK